MSPAERQCSGWQTHGSRLQGRASHTPAWHDRLLAQWHAVQTAKGLPGTFPQWLLAHHSHEAAAYAARVCPPDLTEARQLQHRLRTIYRSQTAAHGAARLAARKALHDQCTTLVFKELRRTAMPTLTLLGHESAAIVEAVDPDQNLLALTAPATFDPAKPIHGGESWCQPVDAHEDAIWLEDVQDITPRTRTTQRIHDTDPQDSVTRLANYWSTYWCRAAQVHEDQWEELVQHLPLRPCLPAQAFPPITSEDIRRHAKGLKPSAATGLDGVSRDDLIHAPDAFLDGLCSL